jgi:Ig-like domain from next to BRCA1 gene
MKRKILIFFAAMASFAGGARGQQPAPARSPEGSAPRDDATFVSQTVPSALRPEEVAPVTIEMKNSGTAAWEPSVRLRATLLNWRISSTEEPKNEPVEPGATRTFRFSVVAPKSPGNYPFQYQLVKRNRSFGEPTRTVMVRVEAPATGNDAKFVSQDVPARMSRRTFYPVSVTMKNTGATTWTAAAGYALDYEPKFKLNDPVRIPLGPSDSIPPGGRKTFTFAVEGPPRDRAKLRWRMVQEGVGKFGGTTPDAPVRIPQFYGNLDLADCRSIKGWAEDAGDLKLHLRVAILADGTQFAFVTADKFRGDLAKARVGKGDHAFEIATPAFLLDGKPHSIAAIVIPSDSHELSDSPKSLTCAARPPAR